MDPFTLGASVIGIGMQLFGGLSSSNDASHLASVQKGMAADEQQINETKRQQMLYEGRRQQLEQYRNVQKLRSQALVSAVNQGANAGTGLQGGQSEISNQGNYNIAGIRQSMQFSDTIFGLNSDISSKKMQVADIQSDLASDQAWTSMGGALVKDAGMIGQLGQQGTSFFKSASSLFSPGSLSGGLA